jgi:3-hydroxyacyl-CoA dehydrogenase
MSTMLATRPAPVAVTYHDRVAVVMIDNPPVNAWSHPVRVSLAETLTSLAADPAIEAVVLACAGKTFSVGADVQELGKPPMDPAMGAVMRQLDALPKILIAAIHGQALGGGLEVALICDARIATADAKFGLPEIKLGLIPGGGGTQRLPRLIGIKPSLDMILTGKTIGTADALANGLIDHIAHGDLVEDAISYATELLAKPRHPRLSALSINAGGIDFFALREQALANAKGLPAAAAAVDAVAAATTKPFADGIAAEAKYFAQCRDSTESASLRYLFAAEREVARVPGQPAAATALPVTSIAVIGAGNMGAGVAISCLDAGYALTLVDTTEAALERGTQHIKKTYESLVARGKLSAAARDDRLARLATGLTLAAAADCDFIIECVFEDLAVKQTLFAKLAAIAKPSAVLATNTSALDINAIAQASGRADAVIGMHFFSPANIMRLVEVVNAAQTKPEILATTMAVAKKLGKIGVVCGVCDGFIGNRMIGGYLREANLLLFEGAKPQQIDNALIQFGMAMGPHAMGDMAGLDIQAAGRKRRRAEGRLTEDDYFGAIADKLVAEGRLGLKTGKGMYRYEAGSRTPIPDPEVEAIISTEAHARGISQRVISDDEIIARCIIPLINEGAKILAEGIAFGAMDIDVIYCNGYGFPRLRGGPMFYADTIGLKAIVNQMENFGKIHGPRHWSPASLLEDLAEKGKNFASLSRATR